MIEEDLFQMRQDLFSGLDVVFFATPIYYGRRCHS